MSVAPKIEPRVEQPVVLNLVQEKPRLVNLDAFRGLGVFTMIAFHTLWDLKQFGDSRFEALRQVPPWAWTATAITIGTVFLLSVGISLVVRSRYYPNESFRRLWKRSGQILLSAMIVTGASFYAMPTTPIYFGILHCIGVTTILASFFVNRRVLCLWLALLIIPIGTWFENMRVPTKAFLIFGLRPTGFQMGDYYPLLPFAGIAFLGIWLAPYFLKLQDRSYPKVLIWAGRLALPIYLIHQPILLGILKLLRLLQGP